MIGLLAFSLWVQEPKPVSIDLKREPAALDFEGNRKNSLMYMPSTAKLVPERPDSVKKEPGYEGTPLYGVVQVGNGPQNDFIVVLAHKETHSKLYVDFNRNGDLTDDPPANWKRIEPTKEGQLPSYQGSVVFPASYKDGARTWTAPYGLNFYWAPGRTQLNYYRAAWSTGEAEIDGQRVSIRLWEDGNDGVYDRRFDTASDPLTLRPVTLVMNEARRDPRGTFEWEGVNYLATIAPDGSKITLTPTLRVVKAPARPAAPRKELLPVGQEAPDFTVESAQTGGPARLSDYRGKVVVLKFWATWCGPCIASMPHFEKIYNTVKDQGVEVLAVCVSDEKDAYKAWLQANRSKYSYPFFFDPAGKAENQSISSRLYNVSGIPTVFVIDKDGRVAASVVGYMEGDIRVEQALEKLGVKTK